MARKDLTLSERTGSLRAALKGSARRIKGAIKELIDLEPHLVPKKEEVLLMYRLQLKTLAMEADNLAREDEEE